MSPVQDLLHIRVDPLTVPTGSSPIQNTVFPPGLPRYLTDKKRNTGKSLFNTHLLQTEV